MPYPYLVTVARRAVAIILLLLASSAPALADQTRVPVVLVFPKDVGFKALTLGLLGDSLANQFINGRGASQMKAFREATPQVDWPSSDFHDYACIGGTSDNVCPDLIRSDGDQHSLVQTLRAKGSERALVISIMQLFDGYKYRSRATLQDMQLHGDTFRVGRTFSAIVESDIPQSILKPMKGSSELMRRYWTEGEVSPLAQAGKASLPEMARMLVTLTRALPTEEQSKPEGWEQLQGVAQYEAAGRLKCHGMCGGTRVFRADDSGVWVTTTGKAGMYGWTLVSLDRETALINSNFLAFVLAPAL